MEKIEKRWVVVPVVVTLNEKQIVSPLAVEITDTDASSIEITVQSTTVNAPVIHTVVTIAKYEDED